MNTAVSARSKPVFWPTPHVARKRCQQDPRDQLNARRSAKSKDVTLVFVLLLLPLLLRLACLGCHIMPEMGRWTRPSGLLNLLLKSLGSLQEVLKWQELPQTKNTKSFLSNS